MSLENRLNRALNQLKILKNSLVSNGKRAIYAGVIASLVLTAGTKIANTKAANPDITNPNKDYSWNSSQDNPQNELIANPELGYVIQTENESDMNSLNNMLKSTGTTDIKQIGGMDHKNLSIVNSNNNNAAKNQETIKALKASNQVRYAAPLFSANGETVAVIPEIVVRIKNEADYSQLEELCNSSNLTIKNKMEFTESEYLIGVSGYDANAVFESVNTLNNTKFIEWASPNIAFQPKLCGEAEPGQFIPNDELFPRQWHLDNTWQSRGTPNADINAPEAWELLGGGGDPNITIAVFDTGVDYNHPDLFENIWVNKNVVTDKNLDGIINIWDVDLDGSGSIDNIELNQFGSDKGVIGWDFLDNDNSPYPILFFPSHPNNAHGTAVAGLVAARGNNSIGVAGVAYNCKIMPIRISEISDNGSNKFVTGEDIATAFRWAAENGADIINCSWGFTDSIKQIIHSAIKDITVQGGIGRNEKGCIVLGSSGNNESSILFPAMLREVIAVGATDHNDVLWGYSTYGPKLEIVAPGGSYPIWSGDFFTTDIRGLLGYNGYESGDYANNFSGTSSSCPVASGVAALVLSANPELTSNEVRRILSRSAKDLGESGWDEFYGNGRVDAFKAVKMALNPPEPFLFVDDDAVNDPGKGNSNISDSLEDGSVEHPFDSIQKAINAAIGKETIILLPGIYTKNGNHDIEFSYKSLTIRSKNGPSDCIIDCQRLGRGFYLHGEGLENSRLEGLTITNGEADYGAGIMSVSSPYYTDTLKIIDCIFSNNYAHKNGGGLYIYYNNIITNCTFSGNSARENGGAIFNNVLSSAKINNCILWGNAPEEIYIESVNPENPPGMAIFVTPQVSYSNIKGGWPGEGNINVDPLFADPNNGNYHLKSQAGRWNPKSQTWVKDDVTSPCIDAGNPGSPLENELLSIPNQPNNKVYNVRIDMGAYGGTSEASFAPYNWTLPADLTNDGTINFKDFEIFGRYWRKTGDNLPADLNKDGKVDAADLSYFTGDWLKVTEQYNKE